MCDTRVGELGICNFKCIDEFKPLIWTGRMNNSSHMECIKLNDTIKHLLHNKVCPPSKSHAQTEGLIFTPSVSKWTSQCLLFFKNTILYKP